jgi:competence protein ComEC
MGIPPEDSSQDNALGDLLTQGIRYVQENPVKTGAGALLGLALLSGDDSDDASSDFEAYVWDVEHGDAMLIKSPEANIIVDLGKHNNGFSPVQQARKHGIEEVDLLVVSHPDLDHIQDIDNFTDYYHPTYFMHSEREIPYIKHKKNELYPNDESYQTITEEYIQLHNRYNWSRSPPAKFGDLTVHEFSLTPEEAGLPKPKARSPKHGPQLNNLSVMNVFEYNGFKLATMGDLESDGIEMLLEREAVIDALRGTNILLAPHHGRRSSYSSQLMEVAKPDLVGASDSGGTENSAIGRYGQEATGTTVQNRDNGSETRYTVTTRQDGVLYFGANSDGSYKVIID